MAPPRPRFFANLDVELQRSLTALCEKEYEPDDCTDLQELAAKAYLLGYREAAAQYSAAMKQKSPLIV